MEILLWLAPAAAVTLIAMVVVTWRGRVGSSEVDQAVALERLGRALAKPASSRSTVSRPQQRSTGVAVRPSRTAPPGR